MLVRLCLGLIFATMVVAPGAARAGCAQEISRLMSKNTERLTSRYYQLNRRIERQGENPSLRAEECRIAKLLEPALASQIAALKRSNCRQDPSVAAMVADIVRGHEDELALIRAVIARADCK